MSKTGKEGGSSTADTAADSDAPLRASREASLGADGLNVSQASGTVPATAPDDSRESAYAGTTPTDDDEFHASREASLGGSYSSSMRAGVLSPEDSELPPGAQPGDPDPERDWASDAGKS
jgi:hypothetical protein